MSVYFGAIKGIDLYAFDSELFEYEQRWLRDAARMILCSIDGVPRVAELNNGEDYLLEWCNVTPKKEVLSFFGLEEVD